MPSWLLPIILAAAAICGFLTWQFFRRMPARWLLDYDEHEISPQLLKAKALPWFPDGACLIISQALLFSLSYLSLGPTIYWLLTLLSAQVLLLIFVADLKTRIIPDQMLVALLALGLFFWLESSLAGREPFLSGFGNRLLAGFIGASFLWLSGFIAEKILRREAMGMGDVKLLLATGFIVGLARLPLLLILSFFTAAFLAVPLLLRRLRRPEADAQMAFGPFIALATLLVLAFAPFFDRLWSWYLDLLIQR